MSPHVALRVLDCSPSKRRGADQKGHCSSNLTTAPIIPYSGIPPTPSPPGSGDRGDRVPARLQVPGPYCRLGFRAVHLPVLVPFAEDAAARGPPDRRWLIEKQHLCLCPPTSGLPERSSGRSRPAIKRAS